ncbi:MAG: asparagine synthase (glutamine-hydrolyzing), partial [Oscillospiraceae bacterium]|nr:asparagine synthase (glutamine-hydrolyzing) [Oscillospiraceae bacterium]
MCGFVGFTNHIENDKQVLNDMMDTIVHRGPDSFGEYIDDDIALGFRRLSIVDLECGDQPMFNEDRSLVLVFNGEIYNADLIRKDLIKKGHVFANHSDSEVLLHSYEEFGYDFVKELRGMFAFIIWDKNKKRIFGARDMFGIKPLNYAKMGDCFMFGSEIKSFLKHPSFIKEFNREALETYLSFQYSACTETFFKNVYKLPPAHYFVYENGNMNIVRYWMADFEAEDDKELSEWVDDIERTFDDSIAAHKIADVEVGSFLSSGVDSSYVACSANVDKTFTVGFSQHNYNEIDYAKELSGYIDVKNISKVITPKEFWENFPKIQYHMDEPLADPSAVALYFVCNKASEYVKVVLSGEGADEIFGGYNVYKDPIENKTYEKIPYVIRHLIAKFISMFPAKRGLNYFVRHGKKIEDRFIGNAYIFTKKERDKIVKNPVGAPPPEKICKPFYDCVQDKDDVTKMQFIDLNLWMVGDILLKADRMSMANSLELRVPFLDKKIMELARKIPLEFRVNKQNTKFAMRQAALRRMPKQVADKKKLGFPVPIRVWLKDDKYYNIV